MTLKEKIDTELKEALKSGDSFRRSVLGMLKSAVQNKEIEKRKKEEGLDDLEMQEVIRSEAKKRMDSSAAFKAAGQTDRAAAEEQEAGILRKYLPPQASDEEIKAAVEKVLGEVGSKSKKDFGRIMGAAVKELSGRADGGRIKNILELMLE
ncbi:MAG: GatB/YqeY domain-containing protein [Patescibacteria group bacterium]